LAATLNYTFNSPDLRERALSHRSVGARNNERLEFLGDGLVNLLIAELLYEHFPHAAEGELTRWRARLVSEPALAAVARELDLGEQLRLGPGELKSGGFRRDSILADAFEALVAAIYLDGGWDSCRRTVRNLFQDRLQEVANAQDKDPKTQLQELLQGKALALPVYELVNTSGADHARIFDVRCSIAALDIHADGRGGSRRAAEQAAAAAAIAQLGARVHDV
jgi:ribonuclease-3